ncbi:MAG: hypothetical protein KKH52_03875 [Nanoarchaeota archaeon]|nr:hypothetical protein [Nanoarchaeota archaeon]MBU1974507.1 hypothetical protein [Nanoarchaeota archaeon]
MNKRMDKRGVFATLSLTLFVLVLLSLSILFFKQASSTESRHVELSFFQNTYDLDQSVQQVFSEAIIEQMGISFTLNGNSLTMEESFPQSYASLDSLLLDLESNIETDFPEVVVDLAPYTDNHLLTVRPFNLTRKVDNGSLIINPLSNVESYNLELTIGGDVSCLNSLSGNGSVDLNFNIPGGSGCAINQDNADGEIIVTTDYGPIELEIEGDGELEFNVTTSLTSSLTINFTGEMENFKVETPIQIGITNPGFGYSKQGVVGLFLLLEN